MELRGYRFEPLVLVLVALATLTVVNVANPQDATRYELTRHLVLHHSIEIAPDLFDRAVYEGRTYSDKAPGMSFLAVPAYQLERALGVARAPGEWDREGDLSLAGIHAATSGLLFLLTVALIGRAGEALVRGTGAATAAVFGTGTLAAPLAQSFFEHDAAGFCAICGFLLVWRKREARRLFLGGLVLGCGVLFSYSVAIVVVIVAAYVALRARRRAGWFLLGGVPPSIALGAYNWAAFESPFHLSYRYIANRYAERQHHGFFGIGLPTIDGLVQTLFVDRGLLLLSPVLVAAAGGLWLLWRRGYRAEAATAGAMTMVLVLVNASYFLPYGGNSPGPRFLTPALPFLVLGIPFAIGRFPVATFLLAAASSVLVSLDSLTWGLRREGDTWYPGHGFSELAKTMWVWVGLDRIQGGGLVGLAALGAVAVGAACFRAGRVSAPSA